MTLKSAPAGPAAARAPSDGPPPRRLDRLGVDGAGLETLVGQERVGQAAESLRLEEDRREAVGLLGGREGVGGVAQQRGIAEMTVIGVRISCTTMARNSRMRRWWRRGGSPASDDSTRWRCSSASWRDRCTA